MSVSVSASVSVSLPVSVSRTENSPLPSPPSSTVPRDKAQFHFSRSLPDHLPPSLTPSLQAVRLMLDQTPLRLAFSRAACRGIAKSVARVFWFVCLIAGG
eukprot:1553823-Rhodomonas_salina.1